MQGMFLRKYGVETTVDFQLYTTDGSEFKTDAAHAAGDSKIMKDEGADTNTTNGFTDEGIGYSIVLTATEMQAARIVLYVVDQGSKVWLDTAVVIETYGHASAMHAFDLDTATQDVNVASMDNNVVTAAAIDNGAITSAKLAADSITNTKLANSAIAEIADGLLTRDLTAVAAPASRSPFNALRFLRNKWSVAAGTLTVYEEDDVTPAWTATVTTTSGDPVTSVDP